MPYKDPAAKREYMRKWMAARRRAWLQREGPCVDCGSLDDLQVDHVDAAVKVSHRIWSWARERREAELAKCVVRCDPCHKKKSAGEKLRGEESGMAKLTGSDVLQIRSSALSGPVLAAQLGVDRTLIWQIRARRIWRHI